MSIVATSMFRTEPAKQSPSGPPRITLRHSSTNQVIETDGAVLEAQFQRGEDYLFFITEDSPVEEALHILLVAPDMEIKDHVIVAVPYTPGILSNIILVPPNKVQFSFFSKDETWVLEILAQCRVHLWGNKFPAKRKTPFLHRTWLELEQFENSGNA